MHVADASSYRPTEKNLLLPASAEVRTDPEIRLERIHVRTHSLTAAVAVPRITLSDKHIDRQQNPDTQNTQSESVSHFSLSIVVGDAAGTCAADRVRRRSLSAGHLAMLSSAVKQGGKKKVMSGILAFRFRCRRRRTAIVLSCC